MAKDQLDKATMALIRTAWASLLDRRTPSSASDVAHFTDHEEDIGFLKDIDALNALLEPFLLAPNAFDDPPLKLDELDGYVQHLLKQLSDQALPDGDPEAKASDKPASVRPFRGFLSLPYPYVQLPVDFVDSAAAVLRLLCNYTQLSDLRRRQIPRPLATATATAACSAIDFLIEAAIEDPAGVRWQGIIKQTEPRDRFANLFFTNCSALALHKAINNPTLVKCMGPDRKDQIDHLLLLVPNWVVGQYDPALKAFWMDALKTANPTIGVLYALELLYILLEKNPDPYPPCCEEALAVVVSKMPGLSQTATLQSDFFHTLPLPTGTGVVFYDDRRYIGAFLSLFALAKAADLDVVSEEFITAGSTLLEGVMREWIDEPTGLWDDGRPLICYTQDALIGLVRYATEGVVNMVSLREDQLRDAIKDALAGDEVIDTLVDAIAQMARRQEENALAAKLKKATRNY